MAITTEPDPTPLVLMLATTLRRGMTAEPGLAEKLRGVAAVCSMNDPQAVTIRFRHGDVHVEHGRAADAGLVITIDLERDGLPGAPEPKVRGAARHPRLALGLDKLLSPPLPPWQDAAERFWQATADEPFMPSGMRIADESGAEQTVGDPTRAGYEVHGTADRLARIFTGGAFLLQEMADGRVHARGAMSAGIALTRAGLDIAMGRIEVSS